MKLPRSFLLLLSSLACASAPANAPSADHAPASVPAAQSATAAEAAARVARAQVPPKLRLGDAARPLRSSVTLTLVPTEETFGGAIDMEMTVREPLPVLWLNANDLTVRRAEAKVAGETVPAKSIATPKDFVGLAFDRELPPGPATVHIEYEGKLSRKDSGGVVKQEEGGRWYVFTHFEPLDARRAYPCFDEPSFKAPWRFTIRTRTGDVAFTNTPLESRQEGADGLTTFRFAETKPLPSYLTAFAAGPLERVDAGVTGRKQTPIGVIVPQGMTAQAGWARESTAQILPLLEDYFGGAYPYEKLDAISVPLFGGAMENPGLVTFAQRIILVRPEEETVDFRRRYGNVATHEFAHLWFGDLVTTAWWNDLWLNEAFASWMTPKIDERWQPSWGSAADRVASRNNAMGADSLLSARRIRQPIESNDDMASAFDGITYGKGAAVIRMFERWVGEEVFQRGVRRYMKEHAHGNATAKDFLAAVSGEAGRDVAAPFSTFLDQPGVPLVTMQLACNNVQAPRLLLAQERYLPEGSQPSREDLAPRWQIPICVRYGAGTRPPPGLVGPGGGRGGAGGIGPPINEERRCTLLVEERGELELPGSCPAWVVPNDAASGYYRVDARDRLLQRLLEDGGPRLSAPERVGAMSDLAAVVRAGRLPYAEMLQLLPKLAQDSDRHVVEAAISWVSGLRDGQLLPDALRGNYARFIRAVFGKRARSLGWKPRPGEADAARLLRPTLLSLVADQGEDPQFIGEAKRLAAAWLSDRRAVHPDVVPVAMAIAAQQGDRAFFDRLHKAALEEKDRHDRNLILGAIGKFRDPNLVDSALALTLSPDLDARETIGIVFSATESPAARPLTYEFVKKNFEALVARLPRDAGAAFPRIGAALCDEEHRPDVEAFFGQRAARFTGGPRAYAQALEGMRLCSAFRRAQGPSVAEYFSSLPRGTVARRNGSGGVGRQ